MQYSLILLAAGKSQRMKQSIPKQYMVLAGKPVIMHSLERLDLLDEITEVLIISNKDYFSSINQMLLNRGFSKDFAFVEGGETRQESVLNGLKVAKYPYVLIHEAARPFVKLEDFSRLINCKQNNATFAIPIPFTVLEGKERIENILNRTRLLNIQLPQKFEKEPLLFAHRQAVAHGKDFTEDASLLFSYSNAEISVLDGSEYNIKLTTSLDMILGEQIYATYILNGDQQI
jgi:2-C-methyl-D-erythritol 4-phosphate cytidylyltransferase